MKPTDRLVAGLLVLSVALVASGCMSPLIDAANRGDVQTVRTLLEQGTQVDVEYVTYDKEGYPISGSALHWAARNGHVQVMKLLLEHGADINFREKVEGNTPLQLASENGQLEAVQFLLDRGANVNTKNDHWGLTPLHKAAWSGHLQIAKLLLERGALCCEADKDGDIPAATARNRGYMALAQLLEQAAAQQLAAAQPSQPAPAAAPSAPLASSKAPTSDVDQPPARRVKIRTNAYAVVVGIEQYQQKLPQADFAAHDAEIMGQYLTKTLGYAEENVVVLLNDRATRTGVEKYIEGWLPDRVEKDDAVFIYFSGHGAPNPKTGKAFLVPYDGDPAFVEQTGYPLDRLYDRLAALPAKEIVVMLDSCFSGAGGRSVIAKGMRPMVLSVENPVLAKGKVVVLAASSGVQVSSTYDQKSHGLLTYFFLKGLSGAADRNQDGRVELGEVFEYLKPQVERTARRDFHNEQTPQLLGSPEQLTKGIRLIERAP